MPDLGQYSITVLSAYGLGVALLVTLALVSLLKANRTRRALKEIESRRTK